MELVRSVVGLLFCDQVDFGCLLSEYEKLCLVLVGMFWYRSYGADWLATSSLTRLARYNAGLIG